MATYEIDRARWKPFFDTFTRRHERWSVTIEILSAQAGDQIEVEGLAFRGISAEDTDAHSVEVLMLGDGEEHLSHRITAPRRCWLNKRDDEFEEEVLEFETQDGATLIHLRSTLSTPALPDSGYY